METPIEGTADIQGVSIHYVCSGSGEPVLLISGLGANAEMWVRQTPAFEQHHTVIRFDNRGAGRSDTPEGPYTIQTMASEAVQLLDALDIPAAHVVGASMGGMIAQEIAIQYPDKALTLTLISTQCGGSHAFGAAPESASALEDLATLDMTPQERARGWVPYTLSQAFRESAPDLVEEYVRVSSVFPSSTEGLRAQWAALMGYDSWERLGFVTAPTLILQGSADLVVPVENADVLGVRIPESQVVLVPDAGHSIAFEAADRVNPLMLEFFAQHRYELEEPEDQDTRSGL